MMSKELLADHDANTLILVSCGYIFQMSKIQGLLQCHPNNFDTVMVMQ
jgi:hypothetical protein